jgi:hypothetical protein
LGNVGGIEAAAQRRMKLPPDNPNHVMGILLKKLSSGGFIAGSDLHQQ